MIRNRPNNPSAKFIYVAGALWLAATICDYGDSQAQSLSSKVASGRSRAPAAEAELFRLRADLIAKTKESRAQAERLLARQEQELSRLQHERERRRVLYEQGLISRSELAEAERALAAGADRVEQGKRSLTESDIAVTEASLGEELLRLPRLPAGAYTEHRNLARYSGNSPWSLADAAKIEDFFSRMFGQRLPISAFGQTATHDRLRFDHRNAIDVALHPDSSQGKSLQSFLREAGIPFIAFRNAAPGAATGAHIHIGQPSLRQ
jgi:hypothetical protein